MEAGPVVAVAATIAGILGSARAGAPANAVAVPAGVVALASAIVLAGPARVACAALGCACLASGAAYRATDGQLHSSVRLWAERRELVVLDGVVIDDPGRARFTAEVLVRARVAEGHRTVLVAATGDDAARLRALQAGDRVTIAGRAALLRNGSDDRARWRHAVARIEGAELLAVHGPAGVALLADAARAVVLRGTRPLPPTPRSLLAGFVLGDTRAIPDDVVTAYRDSGLAHLLAVSGENVAFVLALCGPVLRRLRLGARTLFAAAVIFMFAAMTRFEPSVLRASVMAAVALLATYAGRPVSVTRRLCVTIVVLLIADPFLLHSVGFQLSCGATAGIAWLAPPIARRVPGPRALRDAFAVSIGAQVGVTPVMLATFARMPLVSPIANVVAAPAAEALGVYGVLASLVSGLVPRAGPLLQRPTVLLIGCVTAVARAGAAVPLTLDRRGSYALVAVASAAASVACGTCRSRRSRRCASALIRSTCGDASL